jgi:octopine/nopaline transport system substrate-binding protein
MRRCIVLCVVAAISFFLFVGGVKAEPKEWTEVRILTEGSFPPWNFTKPDGTLSGFDVDFARDLCKRMNVKCSITGQSFDTFIPALNAGKFDALFDFIGITPKRKEVMAFSIPYASISYTFATLKGSDIARQLPLEDKVYSMDVGEAADKALAKIKTVLKDKTMGTLAAGTSVTFVQTYLNGVVLMRQYKTLESRTLDLVAGRIDIVVGSKDTLLGAMGQPGNENIVLAGPCFVGGIFGEGGGIGLRKEDTKLKAMFDKAIGEAKADGTIKRLSEKYIGFDVTPR